MKKRIVLLNSCKGLYGGIESFLLNVFRGLDKNIFEVVFLTCGVSTYEMYRHEIESLGGKIFCIDTYPNNIKTELIVYQELKKFFSEYNPDVVHINSSALSFQILSSLAAKNAGVKNTILHSHNFVPNVNYIKKQCRNILKPILTKTGTQFLACSKGAAEWMFETKIKDEVKVVPNGINTEEFRYHDNKRRTFRKKIGISEETKVLGNIGRFQSQKNHYFLIDLFYEYQKKIKNSVLLLIGEGELKADIIKYAQQKGVSRKIQFLGERNDVGEFFSAIDVFVLPSLFEGFPISAIEAQASGVPCLLSDTITKDINITKEVNFISISSTDKWVVELLNIKSNKNRGINADYILSHGYDKSESGKIMSRIYLEK